MNIAKYILQGTAHEIVLIFDFIDFSWLSFTVIGILLILFNIKKLYKNVVSIASALLGVIKIPIVYIGILIISGMYILTSSLFKDSASLYFILITIISLIRDICDFFQDINPIITINYLIKSSLSIAKGSFILLFIRIINIVDIWDFENIKYCYIYIVYLLILVLLTLLKKIYIIIEGQQGKLKAYKKEQNLISLFLLYLYTLKLIKNFEISNAFLFSFYKFEQLGSLASNMHKIKLQILQLNEIVAFDQLDINLLRRMGVERYVNKIKENI